MAITHSKVTSGAVDATAEVDLSDWNDAHTGNLPVTQLNDGTGATSSTFWRGDGTWAAPSVVGGSSGQIQYNNSGALGGIAEATTSATDVMALAPTAGTTKHALTITQTLPSGTIASAYNANYISVVNGGYQTPPGGTTDSMGLFPVVSGLRLDYQSAGGGAGQFPIQIGALFATKATSRGQQLVGLNGTTYTNIDSAGEDAFWSVIGYANVGPAANIKSVYGLDAEVATSSTATIINRVGVMSTSQGAGRGSAIDTAFGVATLEDKYGAPLPFNNLMVLWTADGVNPPLGAAGSLIVANSAFSMGYGINLPNVTFATKILDFGATKFQTDGPTGNTLIGGGSSGTGSLTLGVAGSNVGKTLFKNATSGTVTVQPPTGALGTVTNTLQAASDTFVYRATTDTLTNKTITGATTLSVGQNLAPVSGTLAAFTNNATARPSFTGNTPIVDVVAASNSKPSVALYSFDQAGAGTGVQPTIFYLASRGTASAQAANQSGDFLGANFAYGYNSNIAGYGTAGGAGFIMTATEAYTGASTLGARVDIYATPVGTAAVARAASFGSGFMVGTTTDPGAGNIAITSGVKLGSFTVAGLPAGTTGLSVWCSNCRVFNGAGTQEGAASGTGGLVNYNGTAWKIAGTNITAIA